MFRIGGLLDSIVICAKKCRNKLKTVRDHWLFWPALVLTASATFGLGIFFALQRDAFGTNTSTYAQRITTIAVAFGPFFAWLGLGQTWTKLEPLLKRVLSHTVGSIALCATLAISGFILLYSACSRTEYLVFCDPADATVAIDNQVVSCATTIWLSGDEPIHATSRGYVALNQIAQDITDAGLLNIELSPRPAWSCKILNKAQTGDLSQWCDKSLAFESKIRIEIAAGEKASGHLLQFTPQQNGYIKILADNCAPEWPPCLEEKPSTCISTNDAAERSARMRITQSCINTNKQIELSVLHCATNQNQTTAPSFEIQQSSDTQDPERIVCEN